MKVSESKLTCSFFTVAFPLVRTLENAFAWNCIFRTATYVCEVSQPISSTGRISVDGARSLPLDLKRSGFCLSSGSFPSVRFLSPSVNLREHIGLCVPRQGVVVIRQLRLLPIPRVSFPFQ